VTPEVTDHFQDGRRRHIGNSSERFIIGNYHPISMKIGTKTQKSMQSLKFIIQKVKSKFQDGRSRHF
jgi:hypothetical protein